MSKNTLLKGIKVLDLSRILAGPWSTQLLADYGATVWKIEKPNSGDDTRGWGPPFIENKGERVSAYFLAANRGKHSLAIDLSCQSGQELIKKLALEADVLVENFKVGGLKRYGLDYASLSAINPQLIYCSITGFGQTGPMANQAGYDAMIQAAGGLMSITGEPAEKVPHAEPQKVGVAVTDLMTGMYAANAILAALNYRNQSGQGQYIDVALLDCQIAMLANQGMNYLVSGNVPQRLGNAHPNIVPYQSFMCADGYLMLAVGNDYQFKLLCEALGFAQLAVSPDFSSNQARVKNRHELVKRVQLVLIENTVSHWNKTLANKGIPCSPVNDIQQSLQQPQVKHRNMVFEMQSADFGGIPQIANPVKFSNACSNSHFAPPQLGKDTAQVLKDVLGIDLDSNA
ncbi:CaiB/BaiF CoA transferase family protein [Aliikangiella sp. IMCC44653]